MDIEHILVFFESPDGRNLWEPVNRENIPDWLRNEAVIERLIAGEVAQRAEDSPARFFKVVEVDRPRPEGQHKARAAAMRAANGESPGGIVLPTMH